MTRSDQYITQRKIFIRTEVEGEPLTITQTEKTTPYRGQDYPTVCVRWKGVHRIQFGEEAFLAEESMVSDAGAKLGVSVVVTKRREVPFTAAERAAGREHINQVLRSMFGCEVDWEEGEEREPC